MELFKKFLSLSPGGDGDDSGGSQDDSSTDTEQGDDSGSLAEDHSEDSDADSSNVSVGDSDNTPTADPNDA